MTVVTNDENELVSTRLVTGWRVCIDYREVETKPPEKTTSLCRLWIKCLRDSQEMNTIVSLMVSRVIFKYQSIRKIRKRPHSPAHTERLLIAACLLAYAMHQARSREKMLKRCEDTNLALNWEKSHFMVKEGIVLGHKISKKGIEVDKAKIDVIAKLPHPTTVKEECIQAFQTLKKKLTEAPILIAPDWDQPFELMCDASDYAIGAVLF
ncbi:reverse transcriptase domain-containing protein [Tanacetum coccineum]|uniref:Reverse transcriptase domain-containing protein n=1 Tax=Tanacetum coccineum TaxID=301880 RepID=A0ABQ5HSH6_9ASTR